MAKLKGLTPSMDAGIIGREAPVTQPVKPGDAVTSYYDEEPGRAKYYVNPNGFVGLKGFELDKPGYMKSALMRQPHASSAGIMARKGEPFK